ncbi:MAG TPA: hypothetical protein VGN20_09705 [Mucilaginibacter sp.]
MKKLSRLLPAASSILLFLVSIVGSTVWRLSYKNAVSVCEEKNHSPPFPTYLLQYLQTTDL